MIAPITPTTNPTMTRIEAAKILARFVGARQLTVIAHCSRGEEGPWFRAKMIALADQIAKMPTTYGQDGKGDQAIAYLHYFSGNADWWITEKDSEPEQHQAFGMVDLGYGPDLGYISIEELIEHGVEIDLHWTPKPLADIKAGIAK